MAYAYTPTTAPTTPFPLYAGWGFFLDIFGQGQMRGPLRLVAGSPSAPGLTFVGDNRTGIYQPEQFAIGWSIFGFLRLLVDGDGVTYYNEAGFGGRFDSDGITADRVYDLPDESGEIALASNHPQKFSGLIGDNTNTTLLVTHNLNTQDVTYCVREAATPYAQITPTAVSFPSVNTLSLTFGTTPDVDEYRVTVIG